MIRWMRGVCLSIGYLETFLRAVCLATYYNYVALLLLAIVLTISKQIPFTIFRFLCVFSLSVSFSRSCSFSLDFFLHLILPRLVPKAQPNDAFFFVDLLLYEIVVYLITKGMLNKCDVSKRVVYFVMRSYYIRPCPIDSASVTNWKWINSTNSISYWSVRC